MWSQHLCVQKCWDLRRICSILVFSIFIYIFIYCISTFSYFFSLFNSLFPTTLQTLWLRWWTYTPKPKFDVKWCGMIMFSIFYFWFCFSFIFVSFVSSSYFLFTTFDIFFHWFFVSVSIFCSFASRDFFFVAKYI